MRIFVPQPREDLNRVRTIDKPCSPYQSDRPNQPTNRLSRPNHGRGLPYQDKPQCGSYQVQVRRIQQDHQGDKDHTKDLSKLGAARRHDVSHFHSSEIDMTHMNSPFSLFPELVKKLNNSNRQMIPVQDPFFRKPLAPITPCASPENGEQ